MQKVAYPENLEDSFISECIHSNEFIQGKVGETNYLYAYVNKRTQQTSFTVKKALLSKCQV
jgi:hypothetical protein